MPWPASQPEAFDLAQLARTLELAEFGRPAARPNPVVGAVLARGGQVLATGFHARWGDLHAERACLAALAGDIPPDVTMYVSLEPCAHEGRQPPCAPELVRRGVRRVLIASPDTSAKAAGVGPRALRDAGVEVVWAPPELAARALQQNAGFHSVHARRRPYVTCKWAMTRNGRVATGDSQRRWISGEQARELVHRMRAGSGAIAVGVDTVIADDPQLTVRGASAAEVVTPPLRVVYDRTLRLPLGCQLARSARELPVLVACGPDADVVREQRLRDIGVDVWRAPAPPGELLRDSLAELCRRGVNDLLLESGPALASAFHAAGLVDAITCFVAPLDAPADQPGFDPAHPLVEAALCGDCARVGPDECWTAIVNPVPVPPQWPPYS